MNQLFQVNSVADDTIQAWRASIHQLNQPPASSIILRPLVADDAQLIDEMHQRLSPESLYYRYLQYRKPSRNEISHVCQLTPERGAGFVATLPADKAHNRGKIVGVAFYVREEAGRSHSAEPGILIEDRYQGLGIGRSLWRQLQDHARANHVRWLRVLFHPNNQRMRSLLQHSTLSYHAGSFEGLQEYLIALGTPAHSSRLPQMLATLAIAHVSDAADYQGLSTDALH